MIFSSLFAPLFHISFSLNNVFLKLTHQSNLQKLSAWFSVLFFCAQSFYFNNIRCQDCTRFATRVRIILHQSKVDLRINKNRVYHIELKSEIVYSNLIPLIYSMADTDSDNKTITAR